MTKREKLAMKYSSKHQIGYRPMLEAAYLAGMEMLASEIFEVVKKRNQLGLAVTLKNLLKEPADE